MIRKKSSFGKISHNKNKHLFAKTFVFLTFDQTIITMQYNFMLTKSERVIYLH